MKTNKLKMNEDLIENDQNMKQVSHFEETP